MAMATCIERVFLGTSHPAAIRPAAGDKPPPYRT